MNGRTRMVGGRWQVALLAGALGILMTVGGVGDARAAEGARPRKMAMGFEVDLLPTVMSATEGRVGGAGQVWLGVDHVKLRLIGASMRMPGFATDRDGFQDQDTAVLALLVDYVWGDDFDGWWVGTGFELWVNQIAHEDSETKANWTNAVYTLGGGYIWKFWGDFYLNPWAAVHVTMNDPDVSLAGKTYDLLPVSAEVSLKIGWNFDL